MNLQFVRDVSIQAHTIAQQVHRTSSSQACTQRTPVSHLLRDFLLLYTLCLTKQDQNESYETKQDGEIVKQQMLMVKEYMYTGTELNRYGVRSGILRTDR